MKTERHGDTVEQFKKQARAEFNAWLKDLTEHSPKVDLADCCTAADWLNDLKNVLDWFDLSVDAVTGVIEDQELPYDAEERRELWRLERLKDSLKVVK